MAQFQANTYTINVSANPTAGGTVTGGGNSFTYNQSCTVSATPATGYTFLRWTENGNTVQGAGASYTFPVTGDRTLVAQFQANTYTINVSANPTAGGTVTGGGNSFTYNQSCTVTATPAQHYHFVNWTENGTVVSTNASYTFNVTANRNLKANFEIDTYQITVTANPANGGTVQINNGTAGSTATGTFAHGTTIQLKATANSGYSFSQWNDGLAQTHNVMVTGVATYTATFTSQPQAPTGALPGKFTINASGDKVYFSKGNLQYRASTNTWRFAENQWDFVGTQNPYSGNAGGTVSGSDNYYISQTYNGWIDLFGWGTSGYHDSGDPYNVNYQPWSTSTAQVNQDYNYYGYGPSTNIPSPNLTGSSANYDWGVYNTISGTTGSWRTLKGGPNNDDNEWYYIFNRRNTASGIRYAKAQVAGVNGVILLPDDWSTSTYSLSNTDTPDASFSSNFINASQWTALEDAGAVFLPAAGNRLGTSVYNVGSGGSYWSASYYGSYGARLVGFDYTYLGTGNYSDRCRGFTVRLVCPCQ